MRPARITSGRHPFEVVALAAVLAIGVTIAIGQNQPVSVRHVMPGWVQLSWQALLILAGALGLLGVWWPGQLDTSLAIESAAMVALGSVTTMYALTVFGYGGLNGIASGVLVSGYAMSAWWRLVQISRERKRAALILEDAGQPWTS